MSYLNEMATALKHATGRTLFHIAFDWLQVHDHVAEELAVLVEETVKEVKRLGGRLDSQNEKLRTLANQLDAQQQQMRTMAAGFETSYAAMAARIAKLEAQQPEGVEALLFGVRK